MKPSITNIQRKKGKKRFIDNGKSIKKRELGKINWNDSQLLMASFGCIKINLIRQLYSM